MKVIKIMGGIICCLALIVLTWGMLYFAVDPIKDWTDKNIFQIEQIVEDDSTLDDEEPDNGSSESVDIYPDFDDPVLQDSPSDEGV